MGFNQLKSKVFQFATGKTVLETAALEPQSQYYFRSCWVQLRLCYAFPPLMAASLSSISQTGTPRCVFYQLACDAKRCSSNEAWVIYCHTNTWFSTCALCILPVQQHMCVSWVSYLSASATQDLQWL